MLVAKRVADSPHSRELVQRNNYLAMNMKIMVLRHNLFLSFTFIAILQVGVVIFVLFILRIIISILYLWCHILSTIN